MANSIKKLGMTCIYSTDPVGLTPYNAGNFGDFWPDNKPAKYDSIDTKVVFRAHMDKFFLIINTKTYY